MYRRTGTSTCRSATNALVPYLRADKGIARKLFRNVKLLWYAGAGMSRHSRRVLDEMGHRNRGRAHHHSHRPWRDRDGAVCHGRSISRWSIPAWSACRRGDATSSLCRRGRGSARGACARPERDAGLLAAYPELTGKPLSTKTASTSSADAPRFADQGRRQQGLLFRRPVCPEAFKLSTGTWVAVGLLRVAIVNHCAPSFVQDVVVRRPRSRSHRRADLPQSSTPAAN